MDGIKIENLENGETFYLTIPEIANLLAFIKTRVEREEKEGFKLPNLRKFLKNIEKIMEWG
ncbi:MAG: hypothetical protein EAX96_20880 [Candidatus Lokiarchaeota archaeon]|nr:hypothetical protein [Candidatus Lokiarchaeota archaeon]